MSDTHNKLQHGNNYNHWKNIGVSLRPQAIFLF